MLFRSRGERFEGNPCHRFAEHGSSSLNHGMWHLRLLLMSSLPSSRFRAGLIRAPWFGSAAPLVGIRACPFLELEVLCKYEGSWLMFFYLQGIA